VLDAAGAPIGITLLNKRVGAGTGLLFAARPGDRVGVFGPLGKPFVPVDPPAEAWMVAGGVGLAPFSTLDAALKAKGTRRRLFYGARSQADLHYADHFERDGATLHLSTEDGSRGDRGRISEPLQRALASAPVGVPVTIYACGPTPMMRAVAALGQAAGHPVFVSLEPTMGCGMGGCYSCVVPVERGRQRVFVRACLEGPVFEARTVAWDALTGH
jgi:dihydroorotate dehydrogenase electron transfer subunit